ncbi:MAG: ATP-grasp domain-containing protein [Acidobacteriota bacterium]|nr:ATP-grasp domain-containing protein [Acidobacteriota bacterium]
MARVVLVVPSTTYRATDFLEAARRRGVEVVVAAEERHVLAGAMGGRFLVVDLDDPEAAAEAVVAHDARFPVDAVVAVDDRGTTVAAAAARRLGLAHNPPEAVAAARDKAVMRGLLEVAEVPQPAYALLPAGAGDDEVRAAVGAVGLPCVIKPTTLSASQGVLRADDPDEAVAVARRVRAIADRAGVAPTAPLLVERFVAGPEVAVEGLLVHGALEVLAVFDKPDPLDGPAFEETIYVTPSRLPAADLAAAAAALQGACRAMGLSEGAVHGELRVSGGRASVVEVAARTIGGLCARALRFRSGASLEELVLAHALGRPLAERPAEGASGVLMIPIPSAGLLLGVEGTDAARAVAGVTEVDITVAPGRPVAPPPDGDRYLGFVFAAGPGPAAVEAALRAAGDRLVVRVEPRPAGDGTTGEPDAGGASRCS